MLGSNHEEARSQLQVVKKSKQVIESGFIHIGLAKEEKTAAVEGRCFWVPVSVRHEVHKTGASGLERHSFFVYGGVSIQPNLKRQELREGNIALNAKYRPWASR